MKTKLIAEVGVNHNAQVDLACKMIDAAKGSGANVVKFQTHISDKEMIHNVGDYVPILKNLYQLIEDVVLDFSQMKEIKSHAEEQGIAFLSTPFSPEAVDDLEKLGVDAYKVGSGETDNFLLLDKICETGKHIYISSGVSTWQEVCDTAYFLNSKDAAFTFMQCTSAYPAPCDTLNLNTLSRFKKLGCDVGFSDHSLSIYPALAAIALGATVIEKHFTLSRSLPGNDQAMSTEPAELKALAEAIEIVEASLGSDSKDDFVVNADLRQVFRHGLVAKEPIEKGANFRKSNITAKRPLAGVPAKLYDEVIGKVCVKSIGPDEPITFDHVYGLEE